MNSRAFINASIFYNRKNWHSLMQDCLKPLISKLSRTQEPAWLIYLNHDKGPNIRFSWYGENISDAKSDLLIIDEHLNNYLRENPSPPNEIDFDVKNAFMDIPNNSARYNLYMHLDWQMPEPRRLVSENILDKLSNEEIDNEMIVSLSLYLHFQLIRSSQVNNHDIFLKLRAVLKKRLDDELAPQLETFHQQNKPVILQIYQDVFSDPISSDLDWLQGWQSEGTKLGIHPSFENHFFRLSSIIHEHLGCSRIQQTATIYLLERTLSDSFVVCI